MPIYRLTVKTMKVSNGQRIDKGLYVDIQTNNFFNPIVSSRDQIQTAFLIQRGVDLKAMGALNGVYLKATRLG